MNYRFRGELLFHHVKNERAETVDDVEDDYSESDHDSHAIEGHFVLGSSVWPVSVGISLV